MNDQTPYGFADPARRYRLDSRIATGGMGVVWRATDTRLDRQVAVKVLKTEYADDPAFRSRFETEARNAAALHHPGIAGVYDYGAGEEDVLPPYLVMELVDGQPLSALLAGAAANGRVLDTAVVQDLLAQASDALGVAHRAGIVHRDVKPANLLVTPGRQVKITDFGIARAADSVALTRTGSVMGTPQYLSPEQARGNPAVPASDVYALGVVAFECLTGRRPFDAETPVATALAHLQQPVPPLPASVPPGLAAVVTRALSKEPSERYANGAAFAAALRDPSVGPPPSTGAATQVMPATSVLPPVVPAPVPGTAPFQRLDSPTAYAGEEEEERRRSPWPLAIALVLLLVGGVLAAALLLGNGDDGADQAADDPATAESTPTEQSSSAEPTPSETAPPEPTTVEVNENDYACREDYQRAVNDLEDAGLQVTWEQDDTPNDGTCDEGTVSRFSRNGTLNEGDQITVFYWGPVAEQTPDPTPSNQPGGGNGNGNNGGPGNGGPGNGGPGAGNATPPAPGGN